MQPLAFGIVHAFIGSYLFAYTPSRVAGLRAEFNADPRGLAQREATRMGGVIRTFKMLTVAELAIILGSAVAIGAGAGTHTWSAVGAGVGIGVETLFTLACDLFAWRRARLYSARLAAFLGG